MCSLVLFVFVCLFVLPFVLFCGVVVLFVVCGADCVCVLLDVLLVFVCYLWFVVCVCFVFDWFLYVVTCCCILDLL